MYANRLTNKMTTYTTPTPIKILDGTKEQYEKLLEEIELLLKGI